MNLLSKHHFGFNNQKSHFKAIIVNAHDNFEQHFGNCVLNVQNAQKSAQNQINSLSYSRNELIKIFRGFHVFKYALWRKNENMLYGKKLYGKKRKPGNTGNQKKAF